MTEDNMWKLLCSLGIAFVLFSTSVASASLTSKDFDPLENVKVTVEILRIRGIEKIDLLNDPDFYVKVFINGEEFTSPIWKNTRYIEKPNWSATLDVPDDEEWVSIKIQLWDSNPFLKDKLCDISGNTDSYPNDHEVNLQYSIKTGHWTGDDKIGLNDPSGYGRLNGCDDGSIYQKDRDCEMWFNIYQNDYDGDGIPYWTEVYQYGTDPETSDTGMDYDCDGIPIEWEYKWGYNPFEWDNHSSLDPDEDSIQNIEEYKTSKFTYSDPYRKDLFVELDQMMKGPNGEKSLLPNGSKELLRNAYDRQNIVYWLDDGSWSETGSEMIPFDETTNKSELYGLYDDYFLHGNSNNWRRGVFHYGLVIYNCSIWHGNAFRNNAYQISSKGVNQKGVKYLRNYHDVAYASVYMHECGHTLGIFHFNTPGCDDQNSRKPSERDWWLWLPYRSCMNYAYTYRLVDYSDGSRPFNDFDDWSRLDFHHFEKEDWW